MDGIIAVTNGYKTQTLISDVDLSPSLSPPPAVILTSPIFSHLALTGSG